MKPLRNILSSTVVVTTLGLGSISTLLVGCGQEAISEGEADPEVALSPSSDGKDSSLHEIGVESEKRSDSGNVNYLAGHIPLATGSADEVRTLVLSKLSGTYQLAPGTDLQVIDEQTDHRGHRFVRLQQTVDGVAVTHGHIVAHISPDGAVLALLGELVPRARVRENGGDGKAAVRSVLAREVSASGLIIHAGPTAAVFTTAAGDVLTAWRAIVEYENNDGRALEEVYIDQASGELLGRYSQIHSALNRQTYDLAQGCVSSGSNLPGRSLFSEGGTSNDTAAMGAYDGVGATYWFYKHYFGRDSYDNQGAKLVSSVHARFSQGSSCSPNNAVWMGYPYNQMAYGDGDGRTLKNLANAVDVTGHELTHAVTGATSKLVYQGEPGALNEAMSDIHGVSVVAWQRGGGGANGNPASFQVDSQTWLVGATAAGPNLGGPALRYMDNPTRDGYSKDYYPERISASGGDNGGVHGNSGIANLAFYLLSQGGHHPRQKTMTEVAGIGMAKAIRIFYTANTSILSPNASFQAARNATAQAAQSLFGNCSAEWESTHKAWDAVGVPGSWTPCSTTPPPSSPPPPPGSPTPPPPNTPATIDEVKPNSTFQTAMAIAKSGTTVVGHLAGARDSGFFKMQLAPGTSLTAHLDVPAGSDFDLYIYNSNGTLIAKSENGAGLADEIKVTNTGTSTFTRYVRVAYYQGGSGASAPYQLKLVW